MKCSLWRFLFASQLFSALYLGDEMHFVYFFAFMIYGAIFLSRYSMSPETGFIGGLIALSFVFLYTYLDDILKELRK